MKKLILPVVLALLLAAPIFWRLGGPALEADQMLQAINDLKQGKTADSQALTVTRIDVDKDARALPADMPRVPDTAELMEIRFSTQNN